MASGEMTLQYMGLRELKRCPRNPKDHDIGGIHESMGRWGFTSPMLIDERTGQLVAGHGRLETLVKMLVSGKEPPARVIEKGGEWYVPVIRGVSFENESEAMAYVVADNRLTEVGGWFEEQLTSVMANLAEQGEAMLRGTGFDLDDVDRMLKEAAKQEIGYSARQMNIDEMAALKKKWGTETGQLWMFGKQRLVIGDCRERAVVAAVLGVENLAAAKIDMLLTDPPYNIKLTRQSVVRKVVAMEGDDQDWETYLQFTQDWLGVTREVMNDPCAVFVFIGFRAYPYLALEARKIWKEQNCIVWVKPTIGLGGHSGNYRFKHELIWTGGEMRVQDQAISDVWDFARDDQELTHVSPKPYDLVAQAIAQVGPESILDPFVGSGTTLLAAEAQHITGYGVEIDPGAAAITLERYAENYGETPILIHPEEK